MSESIPDPITAALDEVAPVQQFDTTPVPMYKVDQNSRIAVSNKNGALWDSRIKAAQKARKNHIDAADECIRYYNHNQTEHRSGDGPTRAANRYFSARRNGSFSETENIVYSNVRAIMPALYAKNPRVALTTLVDEFKDFVRLDERLTNHLAALPNAPGLNLAVHGRQATLAAELCNLAWLEVGYTERAKSSDMVQNDLIALSEELATAQDEKKIREIEGKIMALEEEMDMFSSPGPFVKFRMMHDVVPDSEAMLPDFSDGKWMAVAEYYPTSYLNAKYREEGSDGQLRSLYMPTDVITNSSGDEDSLASFKLFNRNETANSYGYKTDAEFKKAQRTKCWRIYDRITRRVYLYADNNWEWPIWAEFDPYGLPSFFPLFPLYFNNTPIGAYARSNVTYYLDQQDAINEIHDETRRARQSIREGLIYDVEIGRDVVEKLFGPNPSQAVGVKLPQGKSLKDAIMEKPNPMMKALQLFDTQRAVQSIDRVSGVSEMLRGAQLKTNTTKYAAESYNSTSGMRLDEKVDAIENCIGRTLHAVAFLCAQFMSQNDVAQLLGRAAAEGWTNYDAATLRDMFQCEAVGGSTQKPTSAARKEMAMQVANTLQPFGQYAPSVVMDIILDVMNNSFDEVVLPLDAFERIQAEVSKRLDQGNNNVPPGGDPNAAPAQGGGEDQLAQVAQIVDALPPQVKRGLGEAIARGVSIAEALPMVLQEMQANGATGEV